jgi:hypothetical protein
MQIDLMYPDPEWKPNDARHSDEESRFVYDYGTIRFHERNVFAYEMHDEE